DICLTGKRLVGGGHACGGNRKQNERQQPAHNSTSQNGGKGLRVVYSSARSSVSEKEAGGWRRPIFLASVWRATARPRPPRIRPPDSSLAPIRDSQALRRRAPDCNRQSASNACPGSP